jgi:hypothetical protein
VLGLHLRKLQWLISSLANLSSHSHSGMTMKPNFYSAVLMALILAFGSAVAQTSTAAANPADSNVSVPSVTYRSVFRETSLGIEQEKLDWRKANNDVGRFERGHVDILKSEEMDEKKAPPSTPLPAPKSNSTHKH